MHTGVLTLVDTYNNSYTFPPTLWPSSGI